MEAMPRWMRAGFPTLGDMATLFRQCYDLPDPARIGGNDLWRKSTQDFQAALEAYAPLWGWVPLKRYDQLKRRVAQLEDKMADQARLIKQFEALLDDKDMGHMAMVTRFQNLIDDQSQAFDQLMQALTPPSKTPQDSDA